MLCIDSLGYAAVRVGAEILKGFFYGFDAAGGKDYADEETFFGAGDFKRRRAVVFEIFFSYLF